jgi:succinylarginine dihydrolase
MNVIEVNFDGLVGPTHHFGGHSYGNIASFLHRHQISYPKKAALEGLRKMRLLLDAQIPQAIIPPQMRPSFETLRALGFEGSDRQIFEKAAQACPLFYALTSSSFMWAANSATFSPSSDTKDGRAHLTVANLGSLFHRSVETAETYTFFKHVFRDRSLFEVHPPLPKGGDFGDEGAANHTRFCAHYGDKGTHLFVYSKSAFEPKKGTFPTRQAKEASEAVARQHGLNSETTFFVQQNPEAIEAGVFHNDVISVGNQNLFLVHEKAFIGTPQALEAVQRQCPLEIFLITEDMLSIKEAVRTYFFNGQLVNLPQGMPYFILPQECASLDLTWLPIKKGFIDLSESMRNGGGPACLRLRCVLNEKEKNSLPASIFLTYALYDRLVEWVKKHYREELHTSDLKDPTLLTETQEALDALTKILQLGSYYGFQREAQNHPEKTS